MDLWRGSAYKIINGELIRQKVGDAAANKYIGTAKTITREQAVEAIKTIRGMMKPLTQTNAVYRGCSNMFKKSCHLETFVSVTVNKEDAEAFQDDGTVYSISIQPGVKGVKTGVEGEILIEDGCFWEYIRNKVLIHPPDSNKGFEWCSSMSRTSSTCPTVHNIGLIQGGVTRRSRKLAVTRRRRGGRRKLNRLRSLRRH